MATWVTHLMIADRIMEQAVGLCRHGFCVGNIAPDCNVENEDWTRFTPSRQVTHWMSGKRKAAGDCERFYEEYLEKREIGSREERSFLLGYYVHLIVDAEFQQMIRDGERVQAAWERIKAHPELNHRAAGMPETWDSVKLLIDKEERGRDIYFLEREYLDAHPDSGFLTEVVGLRSFPDYIDYLPKGSIARKVSIMGWIPEKQESRYPYIGISKEEYAAFVEEAIQLALAALRGKAGEQWVFERSGGAE